MLDLRVSTDFRVFYFPTYYWVKFSTAAQLDHMEIANFAHVSWAMLLNSKEVKHN